MDTINIDQQQLIWEKARLRKRTRRRFLIGAGALIGASALGVGDVSWLRRPGRTLLSYNDGLGEITTDGVDTIAWSPNGAWIASTTSAGTLQIHNASTGAKLFGVYALKTAWSPDSKYLAVLTRGLSDDKPPT